MNARFIIEIIKWPGRVVKHAGKTILRSRFQNVLDSISDIDSLQVTRTERKSYYVIRRESRAMGICTHVLLYLNFIAYAIKKNYIPVIDMKSYPNIYNGFTTGEINSWELYFEQPCQLGLGDIDGNVRYAYKSILPGLHPTLERMDDEKIAFWAGIYHKYIRYNTKTEQYVKKEAEMLKNQKVLGVLYRGTDYTMGKPKGHPIQPELEEMIGHVKAEFLKGSYDKVYLATEDSAADKRFREEFGDKLLINKRQYYDKDKYDFTMQKLWEVSFDRENDAYLKGLEYISSIDILSKCDGFIGGACAGSYTAIIMNDNRYQYRYLYNLGVYR